MSDWLDTVMWNADGLVPAIAQEASGTVLTLAWMDREALSRTAATGLAHYWSRSRRRLWQKGESSGHFQRVREIRLDCDNDAILLIVEQDRRDCLSYRPAPVFFPAARQRRLAHGRARHQGSESHLWPDMTIFCSALRRR